MTEYNTNNEINKQVNFEFDRMKVDDKYKSNCRKKNWSSEDEAMINNQISIELNAHHIYNFLYSQFLSDRFGFPGLAKFFKKSSDDELEHARKFIEYQNIRGGTVDFSNRGIIIPTLNFLEESDKSIPYQAIKYALNCEQKVYESILNISKTTNDTALEDFLDEFLKEQLEDQNKLGILLTQLENIGNNGHGLYQFDKDL